MVEESSCQYDKTNARNEGTDDTGELGRWARRQKLGVYRQRVQINLLEQTSQPSLLN